MQEMEKMLRKRKLDEERELMAMKQPRLDVSIDELMQHCNTFVPRLDLDLSTLKRELTLN